MDSDEPETCPPKSPLPRRGPRSFKIQRLADCDHFHYSFVELGPIKITISDVLHEEDTNCVFVLQINSNNKTWDIERLREELESFDCQLHRCVFERRLSRLEELSTMRHLDASQFKEYMTSYFARLSQLTGSIITCYPVLKFLEVDFKGDRFEPAEQTSINVPAIAAAVVTKDFEPTDPSHLRIRTGDILSIIEMPTMTLNNNVMWKAKLTISNRKDLDSRFGFEVGYFPSDCVMLIDDKGIQNNARKDRLRGARKMSDMIRSKVRRRDPIFGVELCEIYEKYGNRVPTIVEKCCAAIEKQGIVTGIYRQCGIQSNIQRLRAKFDSGAEPDLYEFGQRDIYSVSSLLKQYFRQLPNPLFTYQSYHQLIKAYGNTEKRIESMQSVIRTMPEAHYRTAKFLLEHLHKICSQTSLTDMTSKNLAIVWSPNLFRAPVGLNGVDSQMLSGLNVHTSICDFCIENALALFDQDEANISKPDQNFTTIEKSATLSDMRSHEDQKWSRFWRGKSVEPFWKFNKKVNDAPNADVRWRRSVRSHSTDASLSQSRTDSILSFMSRGMGEIRDGVRSLRARARSMRPTSRPPPSPRPLRARISQGSTHSKNNYDRYGGPMQESIVTTSSISHVTDEAFLEKKTPPILKRTVSLNESDETSREDSDVKEKRVMFKQDHQEHEARIDERSSPVEEWSSDSRESIHLEMSRYDNVSPSGTLTRMPFGLPGRGTSNTLGAN